MNEGGVVTENNEGDSLHTYTHEAYVIYIQDDR